MNGNYQRESKVVIYDSNVLKSILLFSSIKLWKYN